MLRELSISTGTTASVRPVCGSTSTGSSRKMPSRSSATARSAISVARFRGDTYPFAPAYVRYTSAAMAMSPRAHAHQGIGNPNVI